MFELEWERQQEDGEIDMLWLSAVMFLLVSSFGGMRGYEVVWTDLALAAYYSMMLADAKMRKILLELAGLWWVDLRWKVVALLGM